VSVLTHRIEHRGYWPWTVLIVVLLGTAASNRDAALDRPVFLGTLLAVGAVVPALLRLGPVPALLASGAATTAYFALGYADGPVYLALPTVTLVVAWSSRVRDWVWPAAIAVTLACGALALRAELYDDIGRASPWQGIGIVAIVAAAGAAAWGGGARPAARLDRTQRAATEERLRMAQDLHDGVGHGLAVIAMQAGAALHVLDKDPAKARENLEAIRSASKESLDALRSELARMSGDPGARRPAPGLDDLDGLLARVRGGGLAVDLTGSVEGLSEPVGQAAYAVVQEALTNVLRHAHATRAIVSFERRAGDLVVTVRDDGAGTGGPGGTGGTGQDGGMGISGMRARVEALGGSLEAGPGPSGFRVRAILPGAA
jgi:signal transduction histidine kinase